MEKIFEISAKSVNAIKEGLVKVEVYKDEYGYTVYNYRINKDYLLDKEWDGTYENRSYALEVAEKNSRNYTFYDREKICKENCGIYD